MIDTHALIEPRLESDWTSNTRLLLHVRGLAIHAIRTVVHHVQGAQLLLHGAFLGLGGRIPFPGTAAPVVECPTRHLKDTAHRRDGENAGGLIRIHESIDRTDMHQRPLRRVANQAAAFSKMMASSRRRLFSLRSRLNSSKSDSFRRATRSTDSSTTCKTSLRKVHSLSPMRQPIDLEKTPIRSDHAALVDICWACVAPLSLPIK